jgi:RimJ/RimL family protein N-acetyltransferase
MAFFNVMLKIKLSTEFESERLELNPLADSDANFIFRLLNSDGWLRFIGDRKIKNETDALAYIARVNASPLLDYRAVRLKTDSTIIGITTLIQREYLDAPDIGFAFLPDYMGKGYAYEASMVMINELQKTESGSNVYAITIPENDSSIRLLEKCGLTRLEEKEIEGETLIVYRRII